MLLKEHTLKPATACMFIRNPETKNLLYKDLKLWFEIHYTFKTNIKSLYNTYTTVKYPNEQAWGREFHM